MPFTLQGAQDEVAPKKFKLEGAQDVSESSLENSDVPKTDYLKEAGRQVGLTSRNLVEGGLSLPAMAANVPASISNKLFDTHFPDQNKAVHDILTKIGLPEPANAEERIVGGIEGALTGTGGAIKGAEALGKAASGPLAQKVLQVLAESPKAQAIAATTGTGAGGIVKEAGAPGWAQMLTTLGAGAAPATLGSFPSFLKNALMAGKSPQEIQQTIQSFRNVGTTPTVGQATENPMVRAAEQLVGKAPAGGAIGQKAVAQQSAIGNTVDRIASGLSPNATAENAGRSIVKGIEGKTGTNFSPDSFMGQTQKIMNQLYENLDKHIPQDKRVGASTFLSTLEHMEKPIAGAPELSKTSLMSNKTSGELNQAAKADTGGIPAKQSNIVDEFGKPFVTPAVKGDGKLPYQTLKEVRTRIGEKIEDAGLDPTINIKELRRVYAALSNDMETAAKEAGPSAKSAFDRANSYTKARYDRLDNLRSVVERNGGPEKVFQAATSGTGEGATTFRTVMKSLPPEGKKALSATILRRLGRATPGKQNDIGDVFSTETFLTNWNRLSPEAKSTMTGAMGKRFKSDMDTIAKVASNLREGSKVYANPSGTASQGAAIGTYGTLGGAIGTGNWGTAALISSGLLANKAVSKLMTNPDFVHWVATAPNSMPALRNHIARLSAIGSANTERQKDNPTQSKSFDNFLQQVKP